MPSGASRPSVHDAVIVGRGINSLTCGALLARHGWNVRVLERNDYLGGAVKTAELSAPGFLHDVFSGWHSAWLTGRAHAVLGAELAARGLRYVNTECPTASVFPDGTAVFVLRSSEETGAEFERHAAGDGDAWLAFVGGHARTGALARDLSQRELTGLSASAIVARAWQRFGTVGLLEVSAGMVETSRDWLNRTFSSEYVRGALAPWSLHAGLGPDCAGSAFATQLLTLGKQRAGSPIPRGGGAQLVETLAGLIAERGGTLEVDRDVERVVVHGSQASGVRLAAGEVVIARRAVICNVTPTQLHGRLLRHPPANALVAARRYRYGLASMQIHYALSEPARWRGDDRLNGTAVIHATSGVDGISKAVNEARRGLLPELPTVVVGQPLTVDASRAPAGAGMLWVQLLELPWHVRGDAGGSIDVGDGTWTEALRERFAERVHDLLRRHITNLDSATLARTTLSPADLQSANLNLHHGDPYSGATTLDQSLLWRPSASIPGHRTAVDRLWHIGASSHPGPGVSGTSGFLVANRLIGRTLSARRLARTTGAAVARAGQRLTTPG
jgi:phytoene dehydrogenase-like protein